MASDRNPVDWVLGNRELLVIVFAVAVWLLNRIGAARRAAGSQNPARQAGSADDEAERTRRVQEEVRRRIAERRGAAKPEMPPPLSQPFEPARMAEEPAPPEEAETDDTEEQVLKRQREIERDLRALEDARAAALAGARAAQRASVVQTQAAVPNPWLGELKNPAGLRRAVVLREILGPPISLR